MFDEFDYALTFKKKFENGQRKVFQPEFGCAQHPKSGRNTKQGTT